MRIWSRGLGKRELVMDLAKCEITREGDRYILKGTVVEPVNWEFRITLEPGDVPGLLRTGMNSGFAVIGLKWFGRVLKAPFARGRESPCWERNPGCGTGRTMDCEPCPAYHAKVPCWSYDWGAAAEPALRTRWREILSTRCANCTIYPGHVESLDRARSALAGGGVEGPAPRGGA